MKEKIYWVTMEVAYHKPMNILEASEKPEEDCLVGGYFQVFGCTSLRKKKMKDMITSYLENADNFNRGQSNITFDEIEIIDDMDLDDFINKDDKIRNHLLGNPKEEGIWYHTGRIFFPSE